MESSEDGFWGTLGQVVSPRLAYSSGRNVAGRGRLLPIVVSTRCGSRIGIAACQWGSESSVSIVAIVNAGNLDEVLETNRSLKPYRPFLGIASYGQAYKLVKLLIQLA